MSMIFRGMPIAMVFALTACASTPVHYHTLLPPMPHEVDAGSSAPFLIDVSPVDVPAQLDQPQWVVRQAQSGVLVLDGERWGSPLSDEVRGALSSELVSTLNTQDVSGLSSHSGKPVMMVKVQIRRLDVWPGNEVQLVADWELGFANDSERPRIVRSGRFDEPVVGSYGEMATACQHVVKDLSGRIASDAAALAHVDRTALADPD
jgi:uncharacterized protein